MPEKPNVGTKQNAPVRLAVTFAWMLYLVNPSEVSVEHQGWKKKCLKCLKFIYGKTDREVEVPNAKAIGRLTPWGKKKTSQRLQFPALAPQFDHCVALETGRCFYSARGDKTAHLLKD